MTLMSTLPAFSNPDDTTIKDILETPRTIAVVGCSPDPGRDSHQIAALLKNKGHTIIPVNPHCQEVLGEPCFANLKDIPVPVDMVDVFRRSLFVSHIAADTITIGASALWLQLGVIDAEAAQRAANIDISEALSICSEQFHRSTHMPFSSYAEADPPLHRLPSRRRQERSKEGHQARGSDPVSRRPRRKGGGRKDPAKDRCHLGQGQGGRVRHVGNNDVYFRRRRRFDGGRSH